MRPNRVTVDIDVLGMNARQPFVQRHRLSANAPTDDLVEAWRRDNSIA